MKIALCGSHQNTLTQAPFDDPDWQIWSMAHRLNHLPRLDVGFEVHKQEPIDLIGQDYVEWLKKPTIPVYVRPDMKAAYPKCKAYPVDKAIKLMGREYFASTFTFMLCKAIMDGATEIGLYGINLTDDEEYIYQKPNCEYLIGLAQGMGIKVTIADGSALCRHNYIYGDGTPVKNPLLQKYIEREQSCAAEIRRLEDQLEQLTGAQHEIQEIIKSLKDTERGAN